MRTLRFPFPSVSSSITQPNPGRWIGLTRLYFPTSLAIDAAGNLFIDDYYNQVIREVDASTGIIHTVAGNGGACSGLSGDGGPATDAFLCYPSGLSFDARGNLFITEAAGDVREVTPSAVPPTQATAAPVFAVAGGSYAWPESVSVSDATPGAKIYLTYDGSAPTTTYASDEYRGPINVNGSITLKAIAAAPGYLPSAPVTVSYTITSPPATISTVAGTGLRARATAGSLATNTPMGIQYGVAVDAAGDLFVPDGYNSVVWKVSASSGIATVLAGTVGDPGYSGDGGSATSAQLSQPGYVALDNSGHLYISDLNDGVVRAVNLSTGIISTYAGSLPAASDLGDGGPSTSARISPQGLAVDSAGNLYIADGRNNRIRMVNAATGIITTVAGGGSGSLGDGGPATSASLPDPTGVVVDPRGNLYIADIGDSRIRLVTASSGKISTIAGNGNFGSGQDGLPATQVAVNSVALTLDAAGNLYFTDGADIRELPVGGRTLITVAGNGYGGNGGSDGTSASLVGLCSPQGLAFNQAGSLYVSDYCDYRVHKITFNAVAATPSISLAAGTYKGAQTVTISDTTTGAAIYYTTDGTMPTTASKAYSGAITIDRSETLRA